MKETLSHIIKDLSQLPTYREFFKKTTVTITREDGVSLWISRHTNTKEEREKYKTYGALMSGAWKAMETTLTIKDDHSFALSFHNSETGVYVVPVNTAKTPLLLAGIFFRKEMNPGRIKNDFRNFARDLTVSLSQNTDSSKKITSKKVTSRNLFPHISNNEIEKLFSHIET